MLGPLVVLAIGSVVAGWVGWPQAIWGSNHFEHFLSPAVQQVESAAVEEPIAHHSAEIALMLVSIGAAAVGLFFAWLLYYKRRDLPQKITVQLGGLYDAVRNKYYVDEGYQALFVWPLIEGSRVLLWRAIDVGAIDKTVNEAADGARALSGGIRTMQSGNIRSYAGWVAAGAAVALIYMLWAGVR